MIFNRMLLFTNELSGLHGAELHMQSTPRKKFFTQYINIHKTKQNKNNFAQKNIYIFIYIKH